MKTKNKGHKVYFINKFNFRTGYVNYTTNNKQRAIELFYKDYNKNDYDILYIHD